MYRKSNFKNKYILLFVIIMLCISIGYAALNSTLNINGRSNISKNTWDVHFENIILDEGSATSNLPEMTDNTITFNTTLNTPGDFYRFSVDIVNAGTITAEIVDMEINTNMTEDVLKYFIMEGYYDDGSYILDSTYILPGRSKTLIINGEFLKDIEKEDLPTEDLELEFTVNIIYEQFEYEEEAQINTLGKTWSQKPGISMYDAINNKYEEMKAQGVSNYPRTTEYIISDMDFGNDIFIDKKGKAINLKDLAVEEGKTYSSTAYFKSVKTSDEDIFSGNHETIFFKLYIYSESQLNLYYDMDIPVFMDSSDTYLNAVHAAFNILYLSALLSNPENIETLEQEIIREVLIGFPSVNEGCGTTILVHRFYLIIDEDGKPVKLSDKIKPLKKYDLLMASLPADDMTFEEAVEVVISELNSKGYTI